VSEKRDDIAEGDATPARRSWSTPTLTAVAAEDAEGVPNGLGGDAGMYS